MIVRNINNSMKHRRYFKLPQSLQKTKVRKFENIPELILKHEACTLTILTSFLSKMLLYYFEGSKQKYFHPRKSCKFKHLCGTQENFFSQLNPPWSSIYNDPLKFVLLLSFLPQNYRYLSSNVL